MSSYAELISIGTFTLDRAQEASAVERRQPKADTVVIKRNYRKAEKQANSHAILDRARSMFFRSRISELSIR